MSQNLCAFCGNYHSVNEKCKEQINREDLVVKILEVAQVHEDTDEGGMVYMPDEEEWGLIVGLARKAAKLSYTNPY
jgi:hypothetical protein